MLSSLLAACNRVMNPTAGSKPKRTGGATTRVPTGGNGLPAPTGDERPLVKQAGLRRYYLKVDGDTRTFLVQLPLGYTTSKTYPVIFFFHSIRGRDTSWVINRAAGDYVEKYQYIAVYGQGANGGYWNVGGNYPFKTVNEPHFVQAMYNWLQSNTNIDTKRIYAVGSSNGAILVHYLAIQMNLFSAGATIAGSLYTDEMKSSAKPIAILQLHGQADKTVPYNGGYNPWGYTFLSAETTAKDWAKVNGCDAEPTVTQLHNNTVTAYTYNNCKTGKPVVLYSLPGVPHKVMQNADADWLYTQIFDFFGKN